MPKLTIKWMPKPEKGDYAAARSFLSLTVSEREARDCVKRLRKARLGEFRAKDIFRASGLSLLGVSNSHVEKDRRKIANRAALAPLLLVRDARHGKVIIADGYHRLCAVYGVDEDAMIPCKIV